MGRRPRVFVTGYPHHIVQRGHDRNAVFVEQTDFEYYLANLVELKDYYDVSLYAYCLMTNHVHVFLLPRGDANAISGLMKRLSARQARFVNRLEKRLGTLWSGRFKSSIIETDHYLLACTRYVELNPVRAGMVCAPEEYPWSSYAQRVGLTKDSWLDADPVTSRLATSAKGRQRAYAAFVAAGIPNHEYKLIRTAVGRNQLTGQNIETSSLLALSLGHCLFCVE